MKLNALLAAATAAAALTASAAAAEQVKIGIAAEPYPPFASLDSSGNWVGWEVEVIGAVCAAAALDCVITPVAWDGIIPSLTGQQIDAIMASMSITEERQKTIDFSDPYYNTPAVIVADKSMDIEPTPESLAGKIVGIQASTIHQAYAQEYFKDAELKVYQTQDEANQDLFAGRIDATQADSIAMADFVNSDTGSCCEIKGAVADDPAILGKGVGAGVRKGDDALREALNKGIAAILADGTHEKITAKYFTTSIY
ncbi:transporter substrate-binding domain-containing protein [Leisingera aquaemixtae]|uniref:Transporter substrate-binding domain-containing protein n=1 Tax=Leisingera aquaemixtae TaxID=1396826 RepID=A0ABY5WGR9_9RHOB|nr:transporter substrate-binding domain-containing protein [Leisingera aquaemixtae]UWQ24043.1 transporter substrate-binding domain-containing protein [Leisingera aquaemixtae]UWQ40665.1 transporter substrate-binding domain-containing protein [Leisingera aquaemixtae]